ncbi:hypothetical protein NQ318_017370 [Aromia moschata]|uniref:Uncharacterized protein n=1 Tax=Aromia moschata TaxID=1265417 RepID=A0AAV8Z2F9_9CUCU|nr:hypothetical protein NQ318_017370 [Aromia moschata]
MMHGFGDLRGVRVYLFFKASLLNSGLFNLSSPSNDKRGLMAVTINYSGYARHLKDEIRAPSGAATDIFIMLQSFNEEQEPEAF